MIYAVYRLSDGVVIKHVTCPPRHLARNIPQGCAAFEGAVDPAIERIDPETRSIVAREQPEISDVDANLVNLARETIARIEAGQVRAIREALLGDDTAVERLREQEPAIVAARATIQRFSKS